MFLQSYISIFFLYCDETKKIKLGGNSQNSTVMKLKNSNCDKNQKFKLPQNLKTQIMTKIVFLLNCDVTQKLKL